MIQNVETKIATRDLDLEKIESLSKYVEILMEEYPNPIGKKELADKSNVTPAMVSKIRPFLFEICNKEKLIWQKLVLKDDAETLQYVFSFFILQGRMPTFLLSNYGKHAVKKKGIPILLSQIKDFPMYLDEKDLEYLIDIFLDNAKKLEFKIKDDFSKPDEVPYTFSIEFAKAFEHMVSEFKFPIETEKDIKQLLKIRDKFFYMAQQWIFSLVQKMDILNSLNGKDRELYIEVYQKTTDFYLRKEFMELTEYVAKQSKEKDLIFSKKYYTIGLFFRPK